MPHRIAIYMQSAFTRAQKINSRAHAITQTHTSYEKEKDEKVCRGMKNTSVRKNQLNYFFVCRGLHSPFPSYVPEVVVVMVGGLQKPSSSNNKLANAEPNPRAAASQLTPQRTPLEWSENSVAHGSVHLLMRTDSVPETHLQKHPATQFQGRFL